MAYVLRILKLVLVAIDDMEPRALRIIIAQAMQGIEGPKGDRTTVAVFKKYETGAEVEIVSLVPFDQSGFGNRTFAHIAIPLPLHDDTRGTSGERSVHKEALDCCVMFENLGSPPGSCLLVVRSDERVVCLQMLLCLAMFEEIPRKLHLLVLLDVVFHLLPDLLLWRQRLKRSRGNLANCWGPRLDGWASLSTV